MRLVVTSLSRGSWGQYQYLILWPPGWSHLGKASFRAKAGKNLHAFQGTG